MKKLLLIVLCFILPPLAVFLHEGLTRKVLWALLWQLLGHVPGVIYGLLVVTKDPAK
ncbi:YqaE/Pmp3 family membrane protein [Sinomonas notoginsengisoli]|uniref:YqaE/Pmp3 family membrane protein n=1 Tax=Sinomonas notoginsengisoli TaxID=1457311 RepID=UPI001F28D056|nr:YqaE/Pmp3 family membrane protein [Sinomonas notoginsengisoli]